MMRPPTEAAYGSSRVRIKRRWQSNACKVLLRIAKKFSASARSRPLTRTHWFRISRCSITGLQIYPWWSIEPGKL